MTGMLLTLATTILNLSFPEIPSDYQPDWPEKNNARAYILDPGGKGDYVSPVYTQHINKNLVKTILEIGSRDALDALELSEYYQCHVFAFECNPQAINICRHNIGSNPNVTLVPLAAWDQTMPRSFFPVLHHQGRYNLGASSLFLFDPSCPDFYQQSEITVQAIRLDQWMEQESIPEIDLLCIDAQGATLQILKGLGSNLSSVKYIIAECEYVRYYSGEALYPEIDEFLRSQGFTQVATLDRLHYFGNPLYTRNDLLSK